MDDQALDHLSPPMKDYLGRQEMVFVSSTDRGGVCRASVQSGPPGFARVLDDTTLMYPLYATDGIVPGLEDPGPVELLFVDAFRTGLSLTVSGRARMIEHDAVKAFAPLLRRMAGIERIEDVVDGRQLTPARWVLVGIVAARTGHLTIPAGLADDPGAGPEAESAEPATPGPPLPAQPVDDDELSFLLPPAWLPA